mmetsp:Transcript_4497/g.7583  ORF Transcript_4497/g.7583 Transcript_4497/m.7583 type:complete len:584 (+) Transcript_4497:64-1815(+)|eukprot:CAMPEP_0119106802 /NCGR_PEP_ID=MMETSP1180-20130426/6324_1 /TAXON_ID=3052 ORGANISM="Chlamydomonas cf sp, Strain CCMP681" /NCGR_SAMPLE_ID=MMETSP1180 /ASSEMBLY_ACC=CAM_ASM_000741 /LENGTH=583 /DNA_ID=CAMNT_0007092191 /DNA_START=64 /DNA_END=1815 /DNA_ORIENTATION=-
MCGILALLNSTDDSAAMRARVLSLSRRQRHRGPDWSGMYQSGNHFLAHERLAIVDPTSGDQPLFNEDRSICVTVNGEIYNHKALRNKILEKAPNKKFATNSDCEVISHLYELFGNDVASMLDGFFVFVILDTRTNSFYIARDPIGVTCLYIGWGRDGSIWASNEMKCLKDDCTRFQQFPPGHYYSSKTGEFHRYYNPKFLTDFEATPERFPSTPLDLTLLRTTFEASVEKRLMSDVPFGVLLSGGLDSSLVAAVANRVLRRNKDMTVWGKLHSFCVGLPGSPDLKAARVVADFLGTDHHEMHFTVQEGIDAIGDVIYHVETFDVTSIRASTPMFLMSRKIKALGVKMVLSGEGADEVFGGYLYFHKAPSKEEFQSETVRKIKDLHKYDCLRANKSTMAWGVEARVPFLDQDFLEVAMSIDPAEKMIDKSKGRIEKYIVRKAFDDETDPYLPKEVLWRQKEQFSDGVGYNWIDGLKEHAEKIVSDEQLKQSPNRFPENTPRTKEAYWYRTIFEGHFPQKAAADTVPGGPSVACSTATAALWDASWAGKEDPSGRSVAGVHDDAYAAIAANGSHVEEPTAKKARV